jgi:hypothetical protein
VVGLGYDYSGESDFKGIGEGISGRYTSGLRVFFNPTRAPREGPYLLVTLNCGVSRLPVGGSLKIDYYTSLSPEMQTYECVFNDPVRGVGAELYVRIKDFPEMTKKFPILSWHADLRDCDGSLVSSNQSFAWAMPEETPPQFSTKQRKTTRSKKSAQGVENETSKTTDDEIVLEKAR